MYQYLKIQYTTYKKKKPLHLDTISQDLRGIN